MINFAVTFLVNNLQNLPFFSPPVKENPYPVIYKSKVHCFLDDLHFKSALIKRIKKM